MLKQLVINTAIVAITLLLLAAVGELTLRGLEKTGVVQAPDPDALKQSVKKSRKLNARLVKSANPVLYLEYDPADPHINNAGHRGADIALKKAPGTYRIAVLGDSVTYGYNVQLPDTFVLQLQERLNAAPAPHPRYEVINFAVSGYGTVSELELYKTKVAAYDPDLVLLQYTLNDAMPTEMVIQTVTDAKTAGRGFGKLATYSRLLAWLQLRWQEATRAARVSGNYATFYDEQKWWQRVDQSVVELKALTQQEQRRFAVVIFPLLLPYDDYPMTRFHQQVQQLLSREQIPWLDLLSAYSAHPCEALKENPGDHTHPNALGHRIAAEQLQAFLGRERLL